MSKRCTLGVIVALCGAVLACGAPERPSLILISVDTLRADRLGCYGYPKPTSPHLDQMAAAGVRFARATAPSPWTVPSHASMLTGLLPVRHGMLDFDRTLPASIPTLAERVQAAGYDTAAFFNIHYFRPPSGLLRGFDHALHFRNWDANRRQLRTAPAAIEQLTAWMDERDGRPFFAFLHTFDVHSDYRPGPAYREEWLQPYDGRFDGRSVTLNRVRRGLLEPSDADMVHAAELYDAGLRHFDDDLAALFDHLERTGLAAETFVVVTSDHGEEFMDHGSVLHGRTLYDEVLRVPLLVRGPGVPAGRVVETPVQLVDIAPSVLDLLGVDPPEVLDGRSWAADWSPESPPAPPRKIFAQAAPWKLWTDSEAHLVSVTEGRFKLIQDLASGRHELFDLEADPGERRDLSSAHPEQVDTLRAAIDGYLGRAGVDGTTVELSEEQVEALRALGYVP